MKLRYITVLMLAAVGAAASAGLIEDGKKLYLAGEYEAAEPILAEAVRKAPRDGNATYYYGATLVALDRPSEAIAPLKVAVTRNVADASRLLAEIAFDEYRVDDADEHLTTWAAALRKAKKPVPERYDEMQSRLVMMRNMLERVERIEVVDSLVVDASDFFLSYKLSSEAGRLVTPALMPVDDASVIYVPQIARELFWAEPDTTGMYRLMSSAILDDGNIERPEPIDIPGTEGADTNYPFMLSDGLTLYFASDCENSLGGYDIFMTRRTPEGDFYEAQNLGMPYNSPYDDYMLAIDETTGAGWWATDRNQIPGKVTIYIFKPLEMRVNCDVDAPDLAARAMVRPIAATQEPGADYSQLLDAIDKLDNKPRDSREDYPEFAMSMGNGKVYRTLSDFKSQQARQAMQQLLATRKEIRGIDNRLATLRVQYANGRKSLESEINTLEQRLADARRRQLQLSNSVIRLENDR